MINGPQFNQKQAIIKSFKSQSRAYINKCINHCLTLIDVERPKPPASPTKK